ncbi:MAG: tetratricopeptide repeat protein [Deltaproteobacteria bacterium]|nr:tetratricopeptide repeat protein [Deltaproteobacteria bacterium]MBN2673633.1 tetratricopeptide repeat protein [Deltaproteobacteria bacterium]
MLFLTVIVYMVTACGANNRESSYEPSVPTAAEKAWEVAHRLEGQGQSSEAIAAYHSLCNGVHAYSRACYDECRLTFDVGRISEGRFCADAFVRAHPDSALAPVAAKSIARSYRKEKAYEKGADALLYLAEQVQGTDVWDSLMYAVASLYRSAGSIAKEESTLMGIIEHGRWGSQLWDNAIWRVIAIQKEKKDDVAEEALIRKMLAAREDSRLIASYHSPYYDDALFRLGMIYLERGDDDNAYRAFKKLSTWKSSRLKDDAVVECARIKMKIGNKDDACELLDDVIRTSGSSSARRAKRYSSEWNCL